MGFFDDYPRFYRTSETSPLPDRLNARHRAIVDLNRDRFEGKRVLDIASHDGRWSFSALQAGAAHVTGIEPRGELIANAVETFDAYGIDRARYEFLQGDVFNLLDGMRFDTVLCLGFYYHTIRHAELLDRIERTGADFVVIDTEVTPMIEERTPPDGGDPRMVYGNPCVIQMLIDPVDNQQMACADAMTRGNRTIVGRPSRAAMRFMAEHFGYRIDEYDWPRHFEDNPAHAAAMVDYHERWRETFLLRK